MSTTTAFVGSIPETYHSALGPLLFEPFARELVARALLGPHERVLELACGTGIVTRSLLPALEASATLVATDLNEAMLDVARRHVGDDPRVRFRQADACGTPMLGQLRERGGVDVAPIRKAVSAALAARYGERPCQATMRALLVTAA